jgi:polyferredoxin
LITKSARYIQDHQQQFVDNWHLMTGSAAPNLMSISLPVLESSQAAHRSPRPRSRLAKWRAASLITVHVLIILHIVHWLLAGETLAPVVLSNAMQTLELGQINPAFVLFALLILITLIVGRFFCGWACHMGALQDLSYWIMRKLGVRPAPFRSRLLPYLPLAFALYMFAWPSFRREVIAPIVQRWWPEGMRYVGHVEPFPGWSVQWTTDQVWSGLPGAWVAIPFLIVCGVAAVYFLGARGFCQYGCPYGGVFKPIERLTPGRIVVDPSKCDECGMCTAVCTSNINVLQELREYKGVVSAHCTRNMDCVSVCPQNALALRLARPAAKVQQSPFLGLGMRTHSSDPTLREEIALLLVFAAIFLITRGLYDVIPMLFAVGLGVCGMVIAWKAMRLVRDRDVRLHRFQFKRAGRIRSAGVVFAMLAALGIALVAQGMAVKYFTWRAGIFDNKVTIPRELVFAHPDAIPPEMKQAAGQARDRYQLASGLRSGGIGLIDTPSNDLRAAWLHTVTGSYREAESLLARVISRRGADDVLIAERARLMAIDGRPDDAVRFLTAESERHPHMPEVARLLASFHAQRGEFDRAIAVLDRHLASAPNDAVTRAMRGSLHLALRDRETPQHDRLGEVVQQP